MLDAALIINDNNPDSAFLLASQAIQLCIPIHFEKGIAKGFMRLGDVYADKGKNDSALRYYHQAMQLREKLNDVKGVAAACNNMSMLFSNISKKDSAFYYELKSVKIYEQSGDSTLAGEAYIALAALYNQYAVYDKSMYYANKALHIFLPQKNTADLELAYSGMGNYYHETKNYKTALNYYQQASVIGEQIKNESQLALDYNNMAACYRALKDNQQALIYFQKSLTLASKIEDNNLMILNLTNIGWFYLNENQPDKSIEFLKQSLAISNKIANKERSIDNYELLANAYAAKKDFATAYQYHQQFSELKDSILNEDKMKQIAEMQTKYETEKKEQSIQQLTLENKQQAVQRNLFLAVAVGLLLLAGLFYQRYYFKSKSNRKLNKAYEDLKNTQEQLIQNEKMASLGRLTAGIAHEIKNPLNFVNNFSSVSLELIHEMAASHTEEEKAEIIKLLVENLERIELHGKRADSILKSMLSPNKNNEKEKLLTNMNELSSEYFMLAFQSSLANQHGFNCDVVKQLAPTLSPLKIMQQDVARVILNLSTNAFYEVDKKAKKTDGFLPKVILSTEEKNGNIFIAITDNGNGMSEALKQKIFEPFFTTKPTGEGTGLGLSLSYDIIKAHGGEIKVESQLNVGSTFTIILPTV